MQAQYSYHRYTIAITAKRESLHKRKPQDTAGAFPLRPLGLLLQSR